MKISKDLYAELLELQAPLHFIRLIADSNGLRALELQPDQKSSSAQLPSASGSARKHIKQAQACLEAYCVHGSFQHLPTLELKGTSFQLRVWEQLRQVPQGEVISYKELAIRVGSPRASRAIGLAMSKNPLPLFIPCHRVVRSNGSLGGFAGGITLKKQLLLHEGRSFQKHKVLPLENRGQSLFLELQAS